MDQLIQIPTQSTLENVTESFPFLNQDEIQNLLKEEESSNSNDQEIESSTKKFDLQKVGQNVYDFVKNYKIRSMHEQNKAQLE